MIMVRAAAYQLSFHVSPAWGRIPPALRFFEDETQIDPDAHVVVIFDEPDEPGVLGYHSEQSGFVFSRVFVQPVLDLGGSALYSTDNPDAITVASVLSHEIVEMFIDPHINAWAEGPKLKQGNLYAYEIVDPVEDDKYVIEVPSQFGWSSVAVSNFVYPAWFDNQSHSGPYDHLGTLHQPFSIAENGYAVVREPAGPARQVYGHRYPEWRKKTKESKYSRTFKRVSESSSVIK